MRARSPVVAVMLRPSHAYRELVAESVAPTLAAALARPAFLALLLGCCVSLSTTGRLTLRLVVSGSVLWSFAPALQALAASVVVLAFARGRLPLARALELYFAGIGPWSLWLLAVAGIAAFAPAETIAAWSAGLGSRVLTTALVPLVWSAFITRGFLRALDLPGVQVHAGLALHGLVIWGSVVLFFLASGQLAPRIIDLMGRR
jgi:hypothetical protein